jgi:hypothetical protein
MLQVDQQMVHNQQQQLTHHHQLVMVGWEVDKIFQELVHILVPTVVPES